MRSAGVLRILSTTAFALVLVGCGASTVGGRVTGSAPPATPSRAAATGGRSGSSRIRGRGRLRTLWVRSPDLGPRGRRQVIVYTPDVKHPDTLPVVYWLTGSGGIPSSACDASAVARLDAAFRAGARPFIMACPAGYPHRQADSEWANSVSGRDRFETFITQWARQAVEGNHPRPAADRAIAGFSMGGFAAASLGLRHPDLYRQVASLCGYFHLDDPDHVFGTTPATQDPHTPDRLVSRARGQRWYLEEAAGDTEKLSAHAAEAFAPKVRAAGAAVVDFSRVAGPHSYAWAVAQLGAVARFLSAGWPG